MLHLPSMDLTPNLALCSLIPHWSTSAASCLPVAESVMFFVGTSPAALVRQVASSGFDPSVALHELAAYLSRTTTSSSSGKMHSWTRFASSWVRDAVEKLCPLPSHPG
ncbi:hypothetical protein ZWY2020_012956 [Hordeum vulgare]|nr:hypothetical protein ZWY2020_012956 [Hordeum vulgare]